MGFCFQDELSQILRPFPPPSYLNACVLQKLLFSDTISPGEL